jgi:phosphatidylserine decarboxylase
MKTDRLPRIRILGTQPLGAASAEDRTDRGLAQFEQLADESGSSPEIVRDLYQRELVLLQHDARIRSYIPVLAMKRVRKALGQQRTRKRVSPGSSSTSSSTSEPGPTAAMSDRSLPRNEVRSTQATTADDPTAYRVGEWLPWDEVFVRRWLEAMLEKTRLEQKALRPEIEDLRILIESDARIFMLFNQMLSQVPRRYQHDPSGQPQIRDYCQMLELLNTIMTHAPEFDQTGLVGCPINAIFDWSMGTAAGMAAFLNDQVNAQLKRILSAWARFLSSSDSTYVLNDDPRKGWFGADALKAMPNFEREFICDPALPHWGFRSWDAFFTREFRPDVRPVASPDDDRVIVNACEAAPYRLARNVSQRDTFWIKSQPYSITHMLANDKLAPLFTAATVYQAYLNPLSYHRWHSPVSGTVVKAYVQDGTYYAEAASHGFDPAGPNDSQSYITALATRAIIFIEANDPRIGLLCVLAVGMAEVSG